MLFGVRGVVVGMRGAAPLRNLGVKGPEDAFTMFGVRPGTGTSEPQQTLRWWWYVLLTPRLHCQCPTTTLASSLRLLFLAAADDFTRSAFRSEH
ncbi:hypothetical protein E2C01_051600 [Portunus trituberculatus]|uniref:Uncharacterized protein n=1 Tax=Portunus trituberculatus TaxID=210409 RepID=A0A5B7GJS6_PORTR|nr:hypothetical protein [Portunus trituberculatus]